VTIPVKILTDAALLHSSDIHPSIFFFLLKCTADKSSTRLFASSPLKRNRISTRVPIGVAPRDVNQTVGALANSFSQNPIPPLIPHDNPSAGLSHPKEKYNSTCLKPLNLKKIKKEKTEEAQL